MLYGNEKKKGRRKDGQGSGPEEEKRRVTAAGWKSGPCRIRRAKDMEKAHLRGESQSVQ